MRIQKNELDANAAFHAGTGEGHRQHGKAHGDAADHEFRRSTSSSRSTSWRCTEVADRPGAGWHHAGRDRPGRINERGRGPEGPDNRGASLGLSRRPASARAASPTSSLRSAVRSCQSGAAARELERVKCRGRRQNSSVTPGSRPASNPASCAFTFESSASGPSAAELAVSSGCPAMRAGRPSSRVSGRPRQDDPIW